MGNVFSKETLLPNHILYPRIVKSSLLSLSGILNVQDLLSKPDVILKKKIGQLLIKEENYAKIEHVWNIKMNSAKMLRVGDMFVQLPT